MSVEEGISDLFDAAQIDLDNALSFYAFCAYVELRDRAYVGPLWRSRSRLIRNSACLLSCLDHSHAGFSEKLDRNSKDLPV